MQQTTYESKKIREKIKTEKRTGEVWKKIPDITGLVTTTVLNTKLGEVENKIPGTSSLEIIAVLNTKIGEVEYKIHVHAKYNTTPELNKVTVTIFDTNSDLYTVSQRDNKNKKKIEKLKTFKF